jgi:hypothetical protein
LTVSWIHSAPSAETKGPRAGQPVHPREISFTAARRAIIAATRDGAATASLPAALTTANRYHALTILARRRIQVDRDRHRDRKIRARPGFPAGGPRLPTLTAPARIAVCGPVTPQAPPAPGRHQLCHSRMTTRPRPSLSAEHPAAAGTQHDPSPKPANALIYMAL